MSDLMTREEVAEHLGIDPESVRSTMRRYGITEQRGYPRDQVLGLQRKQSSRRKDTTMSTTTYTLHVVRGEQPAAAGTELGQSDLEGVDLGQDVWDWLSLHGAGADDLTWVLVTEADEHPGELRNLVAQRDVAVETTP